MELFGPPDVGRGFAPHALEGVGVEATERLGVEWEAAPQLHGAGAALFEGGVVEEGVGLAVEDLMREHRRLGRIHEVDAHRAPLHASQEGHEAVDVHGLVQAVQERLADEDVIGDHDGTARRRSPGTRPGPGRRRP